MRRDLISIQLQLFSYFPFMDTQILKQGKPLQDFYNPNPSDIFQEPQQLPQFFQSNLVDDARVIKVFYNDPQANIRIFYYQYLKLCFEIQNPQYQFHIDRIQKILTDPEFCFFFPEDQELDQSIYNDKQFKRLMIEFFDFLSQGNCTVWKALGYYPIADAVLTSFFRSILMLYGKAQSFDSYVDRQILYEVLTSTFNVQVSLHGDCIKFVEIDLFAYEQSPNEVYMIFIDYEKGAEQNQPVNELYSELESKEQEQNSRLPQQNYELQEKQLTKNQSVDICQDKTFSTRDNALNPTENIPKQNNQKNKKNISYMGNSNIYDFVDFTSQKNPQDQSENNKQTLNSLLTNKKYPNHLQVVQECENDNNTYLKNFSSSLNQQSKAKDQVSKKQEKNQSPFEMIAPKNQKDIRIGENDTKNMKNYTLQLHSYNLNQKPKLYDNFNYATVPTYTSQTTPFSLIASNKQLQPKNKTINYYQSAGTTNSFVKQNSNNQDYTDSFTLEKVAQPYKTTIRTIKNRARAQRKANQFIL